MRKMDTSALRLLVAVPVAEVAEVAVVWAWEWAVGRS
jgi:hypothetical protein